MLGTDLSQELYHDHKVFGADVIRRSSLAISGFYKLDITKKQNVLAVIKNLNPDIVIHAAAWTDVDGCELDPERATLVNDVGTGHVVLACQQVNAIMVYVSTDFVFDGQAERPYKEVDLPAPLNVYGATKLAGEQRVAGGLGRYYIVRTAWLFGRHGHNFVKTILRLADEREELPVVNDQTGSPTYAKDLARQIVELIETDEFGLYHIVNDGHTTWCDFAREILAAAGKEAVVVVPIASAELNRPARRPRNSVLSSCRLPRLGLDKMRHYSSALSEYISELDRSDLG